MRRRWVAPTLVPVALAVACGGGRGAVPADDEPSNAEPPNEPQPAALPAPDAPDAPDAPEARDEPKGPEGIVRNLVQDRRGDVWAASFNGLYRYDGRAFVDVMAETALPRERVFGALESSVGELWFSTVGGGVFRYRPAQDGGSWTHYTTADGLVSDRVTEISEDSRGRIWLATAAGISRFEDDGFTNFTPEDGLCGADVNDVEQDAQGRVWIGTRGEACVLEGETFTTLKGPDGQSFFNVRAIVRDGDRMWIGGNAGLWAFDGGPADGAPGDGGVRRHHEPFVGFILRDGAGNLWTSSQSPGATQANEGWQVSRWDAANLHDPDAAPTVVLEDTGMFFGLLEAQDGAIWLGTLDGVRRYDGSAWTVF